jgi:hypothetical protein
VDDNASGWPTDRLHVFEFHVDWNDLTASTFTGPAVLDTAPFTALCPTTADCIPQPGTAQRLDAIGDRLMNRLQYRNFGDHETLVTNHTVDADGSGHAGVRWYELRRSGGAWAIYQQGTYAPDGDHRWMGSAAMDRGGNLAVGYSVASAATFPSVRYAGRLATDPLGTLAQSETTLVAGGGAQTGSNRWGDYSMLAIDPVDDCTFWYTQEYYASTSASGWRSRIGAFRFPSSACAPTPTATPTATATAVPPTATSSPTPTGSVTATPTASATPTPISGPTSGPTAPPTPTSTLPPNTTPTSSLTAVPSPTSTPSATPPPPSSTPLPTATPGPCAPRPPVAVSAVPNGDGRLRVAIAAQVLPATPSNQLSALRFTSLDNAIVEGLPGQASLTTPSTVLLPNAAHQTTFLVRRAAAGQATTVRLVVVDVCGDWSTLVGGGAVAF